MSLDTASFEVVRNCWQSFVSLLQEGLVDLLLCNEDEALAVAEAGSQPQHDVHECPVSKSGVFLTVGQANRPCMFECIHTNDTAGRCWHGRLVSSDQKCLAWASAHISGVSVWQ